MKEQRHWYDVLSGDQLHTQVPFHRISAQLQTMERQGYKFDSSPTPTGYMLFCTKSPNDVIRQMAQAGISA